MLNYSTPVSGFHRIEIVFSFSKRITHVHRFVSTYFSNENIENVILLGLTLVQQQSMTWGCDGCTLDFETKDGKMNRLMSSHGHIDAIFPVQTRKNNGQTLPIRKNKVVFVITRASHSK